MVLPRDSLRSGACAQINSATWARAASITHLSFEPNLYALDGLPHYLEKDER